MKEENTKKLIGRKVSIEELENISKKVVRKSLRVMASSTSSLYIHKLLEYKDTDTIKDLEQEVATQLIIDGYVITKNAFHIVRNYLYKNYEKTELEIFSSEEEEQKALDNASYKISFVNNNNEEMKKTCNFSIESLGLTDRQNEIIKMYANGVSRYKIAEMLGVSSVGTINNTIKRIKDKIIEMYV